MTTKRKAIFVAAVCAAALVGIGYRVTYEAWLALQIWKTEGSIDGLLKPRSHVYVIGQLHPSTTSEVYVTLRGGGISNDLPVHANGCFILSVPGPQGTFGVLAPAFKRTTGGVNAGFNAMDLNLSSLSSAQDSSVSIRSITLVQFLEGMRKCHGSN